MGRPKLGTNGDPQSTGRSESVDPYIKKHLPGATKYAQPVPSLAQIGRSQTSPVELEGPQRYGSIDTSLQVTTSEPTPGKPSYHRPKPSVAAAIRPLDEIGSMSSFKPSRSLRGRKDSALAANAEVRSDDRYHGAPPVPKSSRALDFGIGNPYHFSTESNSSNDSSGSDVRTASSRSSPPLTESPQRPTRKTDTSRLDNLMNDFQFDLDISPVIEQSVEQSVPSRYKSPLSFSRASYGKPTEPPRGHDQLSGPSTTSGLQTRSQDYRRPSYDALTPSYPLQQGTLRRSPAPTPTSGSLPPKSSPPRAPRPPPSNKGNCRGCGELIFGKSVSSADGRLTGRYHKSCFICKTCKEPFQTTDFYVIGNHPYCGRHYHQLNGSLCTTCDQGIEGQYLEIEVKQKYHPCCFTCQVGSETPVNRLLMM